MKLAIMQPYFFPGLGYFDLIHLTERWVVFDTPQYIRHGWVNRNRVHHPTKGWQYIVVPLEAHSRDTVIKDIRVHPDNAWKKKLLGQLQHYKKRAPFYAETVTLAEECLAPEETSLSRLNTHCLEVVCRKLGIRFDYTYFSEMNLTLGDVDGPGDWALRISQAMGADQYFNFPGGEAIFDPAKYEAGGVKLFIRRFTDMDYAPGEYERITGLSILDVLMWNSADSIRAYLDAARAQALVAQSP